MADSNPSQDEQPNSNPDTDPGSSCHSSYPGIATALALDRFNRAELTAGLEDGRPRAHATPSPSPPLFVPFSPTFDHLPSDSLAT